jgi:5-methylcytosine-specific restriction endonuclease McrA
MANRQQRKAEFWIILLAIVLVAYALIADWWKEHVVLGWLIFGIVVAVLVFVLYRFRERVFNGIRTAIDRLTHQTTEPPALSEPEFIPIPNLTQYERALFINRIGNRCENPTCRKTGDLHVHHIKPRRERGSTNSVSNLLVLCPNCHGDANKSIPSRARQFEWARNHNGERRRLVDSGEWKYG